MECIVNVERRYIAFMKLPHLTERH